MPDIAVIVVNWNAREDLRRCLEQIFAQPQPKVSFGAFVVDNASSDSSAPMVAEEFPQARLIQNPDNRGFSRANNQAIAIARAEGYRYVYLLNSDAFLSSPAVLDEIVRFGDAHPKVGIFGTKVLNIDGTLQLSCRSFPTLGAGFFRNTLLGRLFPRNKYARRYLMADFDHTQARQVDWVSGCSMVIRMDLIEQIGALDELFFMYCEDVDICKRAWDAGWEVWYNPEPTVTHKIGASSDKNGDAMIWEFHRSWELYDKKHNPGFRPLRRLLVKGGLWLRAEVRILNRRRARRDRAREAREAGKS
jgi:GT2 family glycosyltransferase